MLTSNNNKKIYAHIIIFNKQVKFIYFSKYDVMLHLNLATFLETLVHATLSVLSIQ